MQTKEKLTSKQARVLKFVVQFHSERGFPPTRWELCRRFEWASPNAAQKHLEALARKGWLRLWPETPRGISVL